MQEEIISILKEQYTRDIRKQIIKSILKSEKDADKQALENSYKIINQIFAYIIGESKWTISPSTNSWDDTPLKIMKEVFPKIEATEWFRGQELSINNTKR